MIRRGLVFSFLSLSLAMGGVGANQKDTKTYLYTYYDRNGHIVVNNLPPAYVRGQGLTLKHVGVGHVRLAISQSEMAQVIKSPELIAMVDDISRAQGVDPYLSRAVIQAESAFNYKARSRAGALGLMQLIPATAERFGVVDPFDPRQNITGGTKYLKYLLNYYQGDLTKTIAAYNAGERAVDRHKGIPPFAETRAYVPRVLQLYNKKLVQPDPKAAGSMALLKKGRGGFLVEDEKTTNAGETPSDSNPSSSEKAPITPSTAVAQLQTPAKKDTPPPPRNSNPIFQWKDSNGRIQISDQPPPRGTKGVRVFGGSN